VRWGPTAGKVFIHATMSLDGFIADPDGALEWAFSFPGPSAATVREITVSIGAVVAGRHAYDLGMMRGDKKVYGGRWNGPQFVLTHRRGDAAQITSAVAQWYSRCVPLRCTPFSPLTCSSSSTPDLPLNDLQPSSLILDSQRQSASTPMHSQ
jgi:hypothetical protein